MNYIKHTREWTHIKQAEHIWISHTPHDKKLCQTMKRIMSYKQVSQHIWIRQNTNESDIHHMIRSDVKDWNASCHTYERVYTNKSDKTHMNQTEHIWIRLAIQHTRRSDVKDEMSHVTHTSGSTHMNQIEQTHNNKSCQCIKWVISNIQVSQHIWIRYGATTVSRID